MTQNSSHDKSSPSAKRFNAWAVILLFGFLVLLPSLAQFAGLGEASGENRNLAEFPKIRKLKEIKDLTRKMDAYVNDRFGLRRQLVHLNSLIRYKLGVSSTKDVVIGKDGWLFYTADFLMEQHTGANVFSPEELERWVATMQATHDCLATRGIPFYILVAPDKNTMYPEKLPDYPRPPSATTRFDQVVERLAQANINLIDPRQKLFAAKAQGVPIYHGGDTHWTKQGAYVAYRLLMEKLESRFPDLVPVTLDDFKVGPPKPATSDLVRLLALNGDLHYEVGTLKRNTPSHKTAQPSERILSGSRRPVVEWHNDLADKPRLLVFGDSFTDYVLGPDFLYETFRDPVYTHHNGGRPNLNLVEEFKPDLVVMEMADRYLHLAPLKPIGFDQVCAGG
jgi:alginate O-acetyltransferase complex protein AlgJ